MWFNIYVELGRHDGGQNFEEQVEFADHIAAFGFMISMVRDTFAPNVYPDVVDLEGRLMMNWEGLPVVIGAWMITPMFSENNYNATAAAA